MVYPQNHKKVYCYNFVPNFAFQKWFCVKAGLQKIGLPRGFHYFSLMIDLVLMQWRHHGVDWGGHVNMSTPVFPEFNFIISHNPLKKFWGGLIFIHSEHSFPSLRTFIHPKAFHLFSP